MVDTFCEHGNYENRAKARTRYLQETLGLEGLKEVFLANVEKAKKTGGLELKELCRPDAAAFSQPSGDSLERRIPQKQPGLYAVKYHPIGGLLPKEMPEKLYQILKEIPKGRVPDRGSRDNLRDQPFGSRSGNRIEGDGGRRPDRV